MPLGLPNSTVNTVIEGSPVPNPVALTRLLVFSNDSLHPMSSETMTPSLLFWVPVALVSIPLAENVHPLFLSQLVCSPPSSQQSLLSFFAWG